MIGLEKNAVRLAQHDPSWIALGRTECDLIKRACPNLVIDVQHVGSTAVPELPAKPILDIAAGIDAKSWPSVKSKLEAVGLIYRADHGDEGGQFFVKEVAPDIRTVHVHVIEYDGVQWRDYLTFRECLCTDGALRRRYAQLKEQLAETRSRDRKGYTSEKQRFIQEVLGRLRRSDGR